MIYAVGTIKDTIENIQRFVDRNLRAGADHLLIFLEGEETEHQAAVLTSPHVTAIPTGADFWHGDRPKNLNARQTHNANLANVLLAAVPWATWLFHIDGDECLHIDRDYLLSLSGEDHAVRLRPLEVVSQDQSTGEPTPFKRLLNPSELETVQERGLIERPSNGAYFRGHVRGKCGVRPSAFLSVRIHEVRAHNDAKVRQHESDRLELLHYESGTAAEFIRKWTALVTKGNVVPQRPERAQIAAGVREALTIGDPAERDRRLWGLYDRYGRDDLDTLDELGLLVHPTSAYHDLQPSPHTADQAASIADLLPVLAASDRRYFRPGFRSVPPIILLRSLVGRRRRRLPSRIIASLEYAMTH